MPKRHSDEPCASSFATGLIATGRKLKDRCTVNGSRSEKNTNPVQQAIPTAITRNRYRVRCSPSRKKAMAKTKTKKAKKERKPLSIPNKTKIVTVSTRH